MKPKNTIWKIFLVSVFFFVASACNNNPSDEEIQNKVTTQLQENQLYSGVSGTVNEGVLTLEGTCEGENCSSQIEKELADIDGIKSVTNNIQQTDAATDLTLRSAVQSVISKYAGVQADVASGVVVLRGTIERSQLQPLMNELETLGAKKLDNQLAVK